MNVNLTVIVGATVIDGTGSPPLRNAALLVEGDRIRLVAPAAETTLPEGAELVDGTGRYVIPGLMDANAHLCLPPPDILLEYEGRWGALVEEAAQICLKSGVTTVFDTCGPLEPLVQVRDRINRGELLGSRIFAAGNIIGFDGPFSRDFYPPGNLLGPDTVDRINRQQEQGVGADLVWRTPEEIRWRVRDYIERSGIDFVKYAACDHGTPLITFSAESQHAIVDEAHRAGITAQAHTISVESLRMEIEAGADILQHGNITGPEPLPEGTLKTIVDRRLPVAAIILTPSYLRWINEHSPEWSQLLFGQTLDANNRRLVEAGARLLLTVDGYVHGPRVVNHPALAPLMKHAPEFPHHIGEGHFLWLQAVTGLGMDPMEALRSATAYVAEAYGVADDLGTLEAGKCADLLILEADPLEDVRNYRRIAGVMKAGALVDLETLPARRLLTEPEAVPTAVAIANR